jgi:hypothetical protein
MRIRRKVSWKSKKGAGNFRGNDLCMRRRGKAVGGGGPLSNPGGTGGLSAKRMLF